MRKAWMRLFKDRTPSRPQLADIPVSRLVTRPAIRTERSTELAEAARLMRHHGVSSLLLDRGAAIVTERDITRAIGAGGQPDEPVESVATVGPIMVDGSLPVVACGGIMLNEQVRHLVVTMDHGWLGVVSIRDVASVLLENADPRLWERGQEMETTSEHWLG